MRSTSGSVQDFLQKVCKEIRFRSVHAKIGRELSDHIEDQKDEYIQQGFSEETATLMAIEQMGDPTLIGKPLNKAHQPITEWSILLITALLVLIGGTLQYFISQSNATRIDAFSYFLHYAPVGLAVFTLMYFFNFTWFVRYSIAIYLVLVSITVMGFYMLSAKVNGSYIHVQYLSLLFIPVLAGIIYRYRNKGWLGVIYSYVYYCIAAYMCIIAPTSSALILFTISYLTILTIAVGREVFGKINRYVLPLIYTFALLVPGLLITTSSYRLASYRVAKLTAMFNPKIDPLGAGYIQITVRNLISSSKPIGAAIFNNVAGSSMAIEEILPSWNTDFSLTYIIAKLGYVPGMAVIVILFILISRMFSSVLKQKNAPAFLVSFAACLAIAGQIILYVLTNLGIFMPMSFNLPFVSYGAYGFITNMALMGLLLSVYRRTNVVASELN
ncbi:MAG TPA: FtsW/RodA/SpoVE family cell cycle protein [Paenibacillus sp.]